MYICQCLLQISNSVIKVSWSHYWRITYTLECVYRAMRVLLHVKKQINRTFLQLQDATVTKLGISLQNNIKKVLSMVLLFQFWSFVHKMYRVSQTAFFFLFKTYCLRYQHCSLATQWHHCIGNLSNFMSFC